MKTLLTLGILSLSLTIANAHCGTCGIGDDDTEHAHHENGHSADLLNSYFTIQKALAGDSLKDAKTGADALLKNYSKTECATEGTECCSGIHKAANTISEANDILKARVAFKSLSDQFITMLKDHGHGGDNVYLAHCPMAMNGGADWLQDNDDLVNPYYGADMLKCGTIARGIGKKKSDHGHEGHNH